MGNGTQGLPGISGAESPGDGEGAAGDLWVCGIWGQNLTMWGWPLLCPMDERTGLEVFLVER